MDTFAFYLYLICLIWHALCLVITRVSEVIMFSSCVYITRDSEVIMFITRDSEVIMFSPCVFVCLCVCVCVVVYVCHDVCPDDLTMKDWCHTNNILQVHCWGCLVVQVMFHALMTSLMTSQDHKVGQILKLIYLRQYLSYSADQKLKMSEMRMAIFLVQLPVKTFVASSKWRPFWKFLNIKHSFNLTSDMKRLSQIMPKKVFSWWWRHRWRHRVASKSTLYIPLWMK